MIKINLDSTCLSGSACILAFKQVVLDGYTSDLKDCKMIYGVSLHKYFDTMYKTKGRHDLAREAAKQSFNVPKTPASVRQQHYVDQNHMICSGFNAWELFFGQDTELELLLLDGQPASEITFSFPYYEDDIMQVNLEGTIDGLAKIKGGIPVIRDIKTTSSWDDKSYFIQYELSRQLRFYRLATVLMAERFPDSILGQLGKGQLGAVIDAIFIKPAPNDNKYKRSEVFLFKTSEIDSFRKTLDSFIQKLRQHIIDNYWPQEGILNGHCIHEKYGKLCQFWHICKQSEQNVKDVLLKRDFIVKPFQPLKYNEANVE